MYTWNASAHTYGDSCVCEQMGEFGVIPNAISFTITMDAMAKGLQWEKAELLLEEMLQRGLQPNAITYNTLMNAYGTSHGDVLFLCNLSNVLRGNNSSGAGLT